MAEHRDFSSVDEAVDAIKQCRGFNMRDLHDCAVREVKQRIRVYPRLVMSGKMTQNEAARQTNMMEAIAHILAPLANMERAKDDLFGGV